MATNVCAETSPPAIKKSRHEESYENSSSSHSDESDEENSSSQSYECDEKSSSHSEISPVMEHKSAETSPTVVKNNRLGDCEVCARAVAKYTCPECEVKTCSLPCVKIHKTELECDGERSRVKFKRMDKLTSLDILSDYRLLEETNRAVSTAKQSNEKCFWENRNFFGQRKGSFLIQGARKKEVGLKLLPVSFAERKHNTTRYVKNKNAFMWKVKWIFRQADDQEFIDHNVSDSLVIGDVLLKYFEPGKYEDLKTKSKMTPYHNKGLHEIEILLPAHGVPGKKYFIMNLKETIAENLKYKNVVEHPTFHVILDTNLPEFNIVHTVIKGQNFLEYNENYDNELDQDELPLNKVS